MHFGNQPRKSNIFDSLKASFGGGAPAAPQPAPTPTQPTNPHSRTQAPVPQPTNVEVDPAKVWQSLFAPTESAKPSTTENGKPATSAWDTSNEALGAKFDGVNFSTLLDPELATKALGGDAQSLISLINTAATAASMYAVKHSLDNSKLGVEEFGKSFKQTIPDDFRKLSIDSALGADPLLSRPELRPVVDMVVNHITTKFPNATIEDYKKGVQDYLAYTAGIVKPTEKAKDSNSPIDFKALLG